MMMMSPAPQLNRSAEAGDSAAHDYEVAAYMIGGSCLRWHRFACGARRPRRSARPQAVLLHTLLRVDVEAGSTNYPDLHRTGLDRAARTADRIIRLGPRPAGVTAFLHLQPARVEAAREGNREGDSEDRGDPSSRRREVQAARDSLACVRIAHQARRRSRRRHHRRRRRRHRRHGRIRRRDVSARHQADSGADDVARAGRQRHRRQGRRQSPARRRT